MSFDPKVLANPAVTVPEFGTVFDQLEDENIRYDTDRICPRLHRGILNFAGYTPKTRDGFNKFLVVLASRQTGKSTCAALAGYAKIAYTPGAYGAIVADVRDRAVDLFRAINTMHDEMPEEVKVKTNSTNEVRQLSFANGSVIRTLSAEQKNMGIGKATSFLQLSELPFWADPDDVWFKLSPAFRNRKKALVIQESTPAPLSEPGAEWYRDMCTSAAGGGTRFEFLFVPYFESALNERTWDGSKPLTNDEIRLLEKYGPQNGEPLSAPGPMLGGDSIAPYLTLENIQFRRNTFKEDKLIRQWPQLFDVFYPKDPVSCWAATGGGAIPAHVLARHIESVLVPWKAPYMEYAEPKPGAIYVIGVDPSGFGAGDEASFQVLEVWHDRLEQVAVFSTNEADPTEVARRVMEAAEKYNDAMVVVENNGVGAGVLAMLKTAHDHGGIMLPTALGFGSEKRYYLKNLYSHQRGAKANPGIAANATNNANAMSALIDALMDRLVLRDESTVSQLMGYKRDKELEDSEKYKLLNPGRRGKGRRDKHHWDRVSALLWAVYLTTQIINPHRPKSKEEMEEERRSRITARQGPKERVNIDPEIDDDGVLRGPRLEMERAAVLTLKEQQSIHGWKRKKRRRRKRY